MVGGVNTETPQEESEHAFAPIDRELARDIVERAMTRYFVARRGKVDAFVDRHFSLRGSLRLHRRAIGWDVARAPLNLALAAPTAALKLSAAGGRMIGAKRLSLWLGSRNLFLATDVSREIEWLLHTELLELPYAQPERSFTRDALAEEIFADPQVTAALQAALQAIASPVDREETRRRLTETMTAYAGSRAAAADIATALLSAGVGALAFQKATPSALTLGPALAAALAQQTAIASFPLGAGIGGLWYGVFPAAASPALLVGTTGGLMAVAAALAAFAGILTDPAQRRLGLHQRRLRRMLDTLERQFRGDGAAQLVVRDHYVGRLLDVVDLLRVAIRAVQ